MKVEVFYLKSGEFHTDGQRLVDEPVEMNKQRIDYYLNGMKARGLNFTSERKIIEVDNPDLIDYYKSKGYKIL